MTSRLDEAVEIIENLTRTAGWSTCRPSSTRRVMCEDARRTATAFLAKRLFEETQRAAAEARLYTEGGHQEEET